MEERLEGMLSPYRVLDLTDEKGLLCGKLLADLGADVIKVERPGGDPARRIGPFYHDEPDPEKSLYWFAFNTNKRGITLDIETADGQEIFNKLVKSTDFVIESFAPGYMDKLGLGYSALEKINPRVIMVSITPFGQTGPYKDYKASDIIVMAMSGYMYVTGYPDDMPMRISLPQSYLHAGGQAAAAALMAHYYREISGQGQHVDASPLEWLSYLTPSVEWFLTKEIEVRTGSGGEQRCVWKCKDGYVATRGVRGGRMMAAGTQALLEWMDSEGMVPDFMKEIDWITLDMRAMDERIEEVINKFFLKHTKKELFEEALRRRFLLFPVTTVQDILEDPMIHRQWDVRNFWMEVEHPELETSITYPGFFFKTSEPLKQPRRRAPLIGEHNEEVYVKEMGLTKEEFIMLKQAGVI